MRVSANRNMRIGSGRQRRAGVVVPMRGLLAVGVLATGVALFGAVVETAQSAGGPGGSEAAGGPAAAERRVVRILAERFSFTPSEIRVARGTTLELRIRSDDTMHGFRIVGRNVNLLVPKRRQGEAVVLFEAAEAGRYDFECSRLCGAGHNFMRGAIVVEDPAATAGGNAGDRPPAGGRRTERAEPGGDVL